MQNKLLLAMQNKLLLAMQNKLLLAMQNKLMLAMQNKLLLHVGEAVAAVASVKRPTLMHITQLVKIYGKKGSKVKDGW